MYIDVPIPVCMSFYYHMRGNAVGELRILLRIKDRKAQPVWEKQGKQSEYWQEEQLLINGEDGVQVLNKIVTRKKMVAIYYTENT